MCRLKYFLKPTELESYFYPIRTGLKNKQGTVHQSEALGGGKTGNKQMVIWNWPFKKKKKKEEEEEEKDSTTQDAMVCRQEHRFSNLARSECKLAFCTA